MTDKDLQTSEQGYRILVESVKAYAVIGLDPQGCVTDWNKGAEYIKGYTANEIIGQHFSVFYTAEDKAAGVPVNNLQIARQMGRLHTEGWRVRKDGSRFWASIEIVPLRGEAQQVAGFGTLTQDVSEQHEAEQKIRQEISDYKHALDEAAIVAITNQKGIITHVNDNFCRIAKYTREELLGQDHRIINSGHHSQAFIRNLWVTIANGGIWRGEIKNRAKDGTCYWVDTTIIPFLNGEGKPYQYLAIRSDITQRKAAEEQLLQINEELEAKVKERTCELTEALEREKELSDMKSRFVSMASHEFRTPLSALLSSLALIEHYALPEHADKRLKHIERIKSSVKNLTNILDDFLSLEKLEQGRVDVVATAFNLRAFTEDVVDEMEGMLKRKGQTVHAVFDGDHTVCQDKKILRNVLLNLLSNACKYSPEEKDIWLRVEIKEGEVQIAVKDEGIGIPAAAQANLFAKFYRAANAVNIQGTGLGLHIVKRYMDLVEGTISFSSAEGKGTTFTVRFPKDLGRQGPVG